VKRGSGKVSRGVLLECLLYNSMRIAVLFFGQPRFLDITKELIKEEFDLPGHTVDYFAHFWDNLGYVPCGEEEPVDKSWVEDTFHDSFPNAKDILVENYIDSGLDEFCQYVNYFGSLHNRPIPFKSHDILPLYYKFGQHWSMKKCYQLIKGYEQSHNFEYDIIIKARTDIVYKAPECYSSEEEYFDTKQRYYFNFEGDSPSILCGALRYLDLSKKINNIPNATGHNQTFHKFYNNKYQIHSDVDAWLPYVDDYNIRLAFNDWFLIANRQGADVMYNNWFENYFLTVSKDIRNNSKKRFFISQSDHSLQGQFLLNYNLQAERVYKRRDIRLLNKEQIKKDVVLDEKILATPNQTNTNFIRFSIIKRFNNKSKDKANEQCNEFAMNNNIIK